MSVIGLLIFKGLLFINAFNENDNEVFTNYIYSKMDFSDWPDNKQVFDQQVKNHFEPFDDKVYSPVFPYKTNLKAKSTSYSFCSIPILEAWLLKFDSSFNFYFIVKSKPEIVELITNKYGSHSEETTIEINQVAYPTAYHWDGKYKIIVGKYHNILDERKYDSCIFIMFGNMSYKELTGAK